MEKEVWNCSGMTAAVVADGGVESMLECVEMANNITELVGDDDGGSVPGLRHRLPRSVYTPTCRVYDFVIETILMGSLCLFGFAGNTLSMVCLWHDKSRSATPLLLISLEISDTLFLSVVLVVRVISSFQVLLSHLPACLLSRPTFTSVI